MQITGAHEQKPRDPIFDFITGTDNLCSCRISKAHVPIGPFQLVTHNGFSTLYVATDTYPSKSYYEYKIESVPGSNGVMYIPGSGQTVTMFCNIQRGGIQTGNTIGIKPGGE